MGMELEGQDSLYFDSYAVTFVDQALKEAIVGDMQNYDQMVMLMDPSMTSTASDMYAQESQEDKEALLVATLRALSAVVSHIDVVHHQSLYTSILGMSIWKCKRVVRDALLDLVISLAATSGKFLDACLDMLVCHFMPPPLNFGHRWRSLKTEVIECIFSSLEEIAYLVPLAPMRLLPIIERRMPAKFAPKPINDMYVECILKLEETTIGEFIGSSLLKAVVDKLVDLDVEIRWEDVQHNDCNKGIFDMELEDMGGNVSGEAEKTASKIAYAVKENKAADTLDGLMAITCQHLKARANSGHLSKVFETLMDSFHKTILLAHRSKFVQFLIFYACSLDPENCGASFAFRLRDIFLSSSEPPLIRMSAIAYLASYLSRAKFHSSSLVIKILKRLVDWCSEYRLSVDGKEISKNIAAHRVFYYGCQGVLYVLCFRLKSIIDDPALKSMLIRMPLKEVFFHGLDPLKVCLPSIVEEFLRQANASGVFKEMTELFDKLLNSELSTGFKSPEWLDMYFPFDPYLLKESDRFISPNFEFWTAVRTTYDSDDEDADEIYGDEEKADKSFDGVNLPDLDNDEQELGYSMDAMSITPKDSFKHFPGSHTSRMPAKLRPSTSPDW